MITRVVEPSRIRRGRLATSPVWLVQRPTGQAGRFQTKKAATKFDAEGCAHVGDQRIGGWCTVCRGSITEAAPGADGGKEGQRG